MEKFSLAPQPQGDLALQKNGQFCACPFQNAIPMPVQSFGSQPRIELVRLNCSSICPHFFIEDDQVFLNCVPNPKYLNIEETETKQENGKIISFPESN